LRAPGYFSARKKAGHHPRFAPSDINPDEREIDEAFVDDLRALIWSDRAAGR
jgi:hypothetical protein